MTSEEAREAVWALIERHAGRAEELAALVNTLQDRHSYMAGSNGQGTRLWRTDWRAVLRDLEEHVKARAN